MIIREGSIAEVVSISDQVPELVRPHRASVYEQRLRGVPHLILVADIDLAPAGFKVGYERDGYWYSWMGGVLPNFRRRGVAKALAEAQEAWAKNHGYPHVTFKTRNSHRRMLQFAIGRGFQIIGLEERENVADHRILLRKWLD
ncbi:MAG: GNAT family N-acetyltransferase [Bacteroidota bacterium]